MFWDRVAGVYDIFVRIINKKTHKMLIKKTVSLFTDQDDYRSGRGSGMCLRNRYAERPCCRCMPSPDCNGFFGKYAEKSKEKLS